MEQMEALKQSIREKEKMVVAFSGGVDSTFLLKVAHDVLGDGAVAVTARSCSFPERELREAKAFCEKEHIKHIVVESEELQIEGFSHNPTNRCYLCKKELFTKIWDIAKEYDIPYVAEASNLDDNGDYRPGLMAVAELSVLSPLREAGMNKSMIRELSHGLGLPTWNKQSFACLSSRFVYGEEITEENLRVTADMSAVTGPGTIPVPVTVTVSGFSDVTVRGTYELTLTVTDTPPQAEPEGTPAGGDTGGATPTASENTTTTVPAAPAA